MKRAGGRFPRMRERAVEVAHVRKLEVGFAAREAEAKVDCCTAAVPMTSVASSIATVSNTTMRMVVSEPPKVSQGSDHSLSCQSLGR